MRDMAWVTISFLILPFSVSAQESDHNDSTHKEKAVIGLWVGVSFDSPNWWGKTRDREFIMCGIRYQRKLFSKSAIDFSHTIDVLPLAIVTKVPVNSRPPLDYDAIFRDWTATELDLDNERRDEAFGFGVAPIGFEVSILVHRPIQFIIGSSSGILIFSRPVPEPLTRRLNFTFEFSIGIRLKISNHLGVTFGYKFHHFSNAHTASQNPGLDSNVFYLGASIF